VIVLDTTILVYGVGADHALREPCRAIVDAVGEGALSATTTVEVIQEFAHVRSRRRDPADAHRLAVTYVDLLSPLVSPNADDLRRGLEIFGTGGSLGAFDAVLAATVERRDHLTALVSADRAFGTLPSIRHVDPADASAVRDLLEPPAG
jgi:predicted nucleic acid-binding protein